jgi:two-component system sensor histidine kinase BarA
MTTVVDYAEAIEKAGGNAQLAKELFGMLLQELPLLREKLQGAIAQEDLPAMWNHAHKIYGSTAYCGVPLLRQVASKMETAVRGKELAAIQQQYAALDKAIEQILEQGPEHLSKAW